MAHHAAPRKIALSLPRGVSSTTAIAAAATALVGAGAFAAWTSTSTSTTGSLTAATVTHTNADTNGTTFTTALTNMLPGDFLYRYRTLTNTGSVSQTFTGATSGTGTLAGTGGLELKVDSCTVAWTTVAGVSTCTGTITPILATAGVSTSPAISYGSLAAAGVVNLRYEIDLPAGASQATFQGQTGTVTVAITGATAAASDRTAG
ncbi:MAG: hypothetical protein M3N21_04380 [Actinomycetota bacterium]|nr:hypothetical protein [Actinomycetota bacterium]